MAPFPIKEMGPLYVRGIEMSYKRKLGDFVREYKYSGATFYVRGLTVGEYTDLAQLNLLETTSDAMYMEVAHCGVVGWENLIDQDGNEFPYSKEVDTDWLPESLQVNLGKYIYNNLTILDKETSDKFRGFIRFLYWSSDDNHRSKTDSFDCESCLESGKALARPCGRFSEETRRAYMMEARGLSESDTQPSEGKPKGRGKYKSKKLSRQRSQRRERNADSNNPVKTMALGGFKFPECPISWIDTWIKVSGEAMYHAEKSDQHFFSGGIADQPYNVFRAAKVVKGEYGKIEEEEMEKERKKNRR